MRKKRRSQPSDDGSPRLKMKVYELLDGYPGNRGGANGEPIFMATVSHLNEISTIAFNVRDTKRLAIHALIALAEVDVDIATQILERHFLDDNGARLDAMD